MRERLVELIPEFDLFEDGDLREKCLRTWEAAMAEGGWQPDDLARLPFTLLINPCPASFIDHIRGVTLVSLRSAEVFAEIYGDTLPINRDYLLAGALLHDIGKLVEYEMRENGTAVQTPKGALLRHPFTGMELAARFGLPDAVQHMIATHASEGDKVQRITEATIINHADFMNFHSLLRLTPPKESAARMVG
jgi:putative nucleotidyltransferase with HDIG domain